MNGKNKDWFIRYLKKLTSMVENGEVYLDAIVYEKERAMVSLDTTTTISIPTGAFKIIVVGFGRVTEDKESI